MIAYLVRRLLAMIPTLLGITLVTFVIISLAPGDPVATTFGAQPGGQSMDAAGSQNQDRMADTIKAKKKLLGMVTEDYSIGAWSAVFAGEPRADEYGQVPALELEERLGDFASWPRSLALTPDGARLYAGTADGWIYALDPGDGELLARIEAHDASVSTLAISPAGDLLVSGDANGQIKVWSLPDHAPMARPAAFDRGVRDLAFLPDGSAFLSASEDQLVRLHDPGNASTRHIYQDHISGVYAIEVAPDGQSFWSGGYDRKLRRWSVDGELLSVDESHGQSINDIALSPDGATLATACDDRLLRLFDLAAGGEPRTLIGHYKQATAVAFSRDGVTLFSGGRDETVRTWSVATGAQLTQAPEATGRVRGLLASPDGEVFWSAADAWRKVPVYQRYLKWLARIATLDFDRSFKDDLPVIDKIAKALPITLGLNVLTVLIIYLISIPLGVLAAVRRGSTFDNVSSLLLFVLYSLPNFWVATLLIMFLSSEQNLNVLPSVGLHADGHQDLSYLPWLWDWIQHLVLPVTVMTYAGFASLSRYARTSMLETIQEDYIRTARAKGLAEVVVIWKHAFRNSLITIVTLLGNLLPRLIGGSVIVEYIFSINGMGKLGFDAILARDYPVIMAITTFSAFLTLLGILVSDLLYSVVDPRVSHK